MNLPITATIKGGMPQWIGDSKAYLYERFKKFEGKNVIITVDGADPKTMGQLGLYYHIWLPLIRCALIDHGFDMMGVPPTIEFTDAIVKHFCARLDGKEIILKRNMSHEKMARFMTNVERWASTTWSIALPEAIRK